MPTLGILCNIISQRQANKNRVRVLRIILFEKKLQLKRPKAGQALKTGKGKPTKMTKGGQAPKKREWCASPGLELRYVYNSKILVMI